MPAQTLIKAGILLLWAVLIFALLRIDQWQYLADTPLINYAAWLMVEHDQMPYRDFFETSMPGTFLVHASIMALGLDGNAAFIGLGVAILALLGWIGARVLGRAALTTGVAFVIFYMTIMLLFGAESLLQRELIGTAFIATAVLVAFGPTPSQLAIGFCFGLAALIKPQLAFAAPTVVIAAILLSRTPAARSITVSLIGFAVPIAATAIWLYAENAFPRFLFLAREYLPLHIQQSTLHFFMEPTPRLKYLIKGSAQFGGFWALVAGPAALTALQFLNRHKITRPEHIMLGTLTILAATYSLIPILAGQFWNYHYFPFIFFATLALAAACDFLRPAFAGLTRASAACTVLAVLAIQGLKLYDPRLVFKNDRDIGIVIEMEKALDRWLPEGGRVQPIDWTKGAIHAMLRKRAMIATPFFYDYHFRHHVSGPVTAKLRKEFLTAITENPPEVFLEVPTRPKMKGVDTSYDWPALDAFLAQNYRIVEAAEHHLIHLRGDL